jgi:hypothetical protein
LVLAILALDRAEREHLKIRIPHGGYEATETSFPTGPVDKSGDENCAIGGAEELVVKSLQFR